jgi:hypothetical protein
MKFEVLSFITPRTTVSSSSFKLYTRDSLLRIINFVETDLFVTMLYGKTIDTVKVSVASGVVGAITSHTFTFNTPIPLVETDQFMIRYPNETMPPYKSDLCSGQGTLADKQSCYVIQNIVQTNGLKFRAPATQVAEGTLLTFTVNQSRNPKSGKPTGPYKIWIKDKDGNVMSEQSSDPNSNMALTMAEPAEILNFNFVRSDERQLALTALELSWNSMMPYPKDSYLNLIINSD